MTVLVPARDTVGDRVRRRPAEAARAMRNLEEGFMNCIGRRLGRGLKGYTGGMGRWVCLRSKGTKGTKRT